MPGAKSVRYKTSKNGVQKARTVNMHMPKGGVPGQALRNHLLAEGVLLPGLPISENFRNPKNTTGARPPKT